MEISNSNNFIKFERFCNVIYRNNAFKALEQNK